MKRVLSFVSIIAVALFAYQCAHATGLRAGSGPWTAIEVEIRRQRVPPPVVGDGP